MDLIVKKFGGTSLASGKLIKNAALRVKNEITKGSKVIVVVSAMAGITNNLLSLTDKATKSKDPLALAEIDSIISTGEQVSAGLMSLYLQELGFKARSLAGWQASLKTNSRFGNAEISSIDTKFLHSLLKEGTIPIISGFQGVDENHRITTLGRGGSDLTAVYVAASMKATRCDIYTDVDGVYTDDPKREQKAEKFHKISYDDMYNMAKKGSKVMQKESVAVAKQYKVLVKVLSTFSPNQKATFITEREDI